MKTFNTYAEILAATKGHQVTAQELINGRTRIEPEGWQSIELTTELKEKLCNDISECLGGWQATKKQVKNSLMFSRPQHWGLSRIFLEQYNGNEPFLSYCAGQDYPSEIKTIRNAIK